MTWRVRVLTAGAVLLATFAQASEVTLEQDLQTFSVETGATRVIYTPGSAGATLTVINPQSYPMLVQSAVWQANKKTKAPFIVTPPLFRLDGHQQNRLKVVSIGDLGPTDQESLNWLCLTGIPPEPNAVWAQDDKVIKAAPAKQATLLTQLRVTSCLKLLVRPASLKGDPVDKAMFLTWHRSGTTLTVNNPTPFFMNLKSVRLGTTSISAPGYVPPKDHLGLKLPEHPAEGPVRWTLVTDYGGESREFSAALQ